MLLAEHNLNKFGAKLIDLILESNSFVKLLRIIIDKLKFVYQISNLSVIANRKSSIARTTYYLTFHQKERYQKPTLMFHSQSSNTISYMKKPHDDLSFEECF